MLYFSVYFEYLKHQPQILFDVTIMTHTRKQGNLLYIKCQILIIYLYMYAFCVSGKIAF